MVIELAQFKMKVGVSEDEVLAASQEAQDGFLAKQKGYVSRELLKSSEGEWVDIVHWETMEDAQTAMNSFMGHPSTKKFGEVIDPSSIKMMHLEVVKKY
ncbi:MAG: antibiotic biosynthesis monooxygenase [Patescibacteria group bacterium]